MKTNKLIDGFFNGTLTDDLDVKLRESVKDSQDFSDTKSYFDLMDDIKSHNPFSDGENVEIDLDRIKLSNKKDNLLIFKRAFIGIAASLLILFSLNMFLNNRNSKTFDYYVSNSGKTEKEAVEIANKMLRLLSESLNKPTSQLQVLSNLEKGYTPFIKFGVVNKFSDGIKKVSYVDYSLDINKNIKTQ